VRRCCIQSALPMVNRLDEVTATSAVPFLMNKDSEVGRS
jgi:hypothetical protein